MSRQNGIDASVSFLLVPFYCQNPNSRFGDKYTVPSNSALGIHPRNHHAYFPHKMSPQDPQIFAAYKPLRNFTRKFSYHDACYVTWAFITYFQLRTRFPSDIHIPFSIRFSSSRHNIPIYEWELETLLREILINGQQTSTTFRLVEWNTLCKGINKVRDFENAVSRITNNPSNIKVQLFRTAHRQFAWQQRKPSSSLITRYHAIFSHSEIDSIFTREYGLSIDELYQIGTILLGSFASNPAMQLPFRSEINELDSDKISNFLEIFSLPIATMVSNLRREQDFSENFFYSFSSLRRYPLLKLTDASDERVVCPNVTALTWQMTEGLFYLLSHVDTFGNAYGISFQEYVGDVLDVALSGTQVQVFKEQKYGPKRERRDSVDWIISDDQTAVFVECKTKRLSMPAKMALNDTSDLDAQLDIMADAIAQTYVNIEACIQGNYEHFSPDTISEFYPLIVTLEDWYPFSDWLLSRLTDRVLAKLSDLSISENFVNEHPFSVCSIDEFEHLVQVCARHNLSRVIGIKAKHDEYKTWIFHSYLAQEFPDDLRASRFLFEDKFDEIFRSLSPKASDRTPI